MFPALLGNRSRALVAAGRHTEALRDARALVQLQERTLGSSASPGSVLGSESSDKRVDGLGLLAKGHYRAGRALDGLQRSVTGQLSRSVTHR